MPTAEAHLATDRASRYLVQLCRHLHQMTRMSHRSPGGRGDRRTPPQVQHVDHTDTQGTVRFADGQWTLRATETELVLRVDADDEESLQRLQEGIAARVEKIGRRDHLRVTWQRLEDREPSAGEAFGQAPEPSRERTPSRRSRGATIGLIAGGALVVALHLGIGGAALAGSAWTGWAANAVLLVVLAKVVLMGSHVLLGRSALRRGGTAWARLVRHGRMPSGPAD